MRRAVPVDRKAVPPATTSGHARTVWRQLNMIISAASSVLCSSGLVWLSVHDGPAAFLT